MAVSYDSIRLVVFLNLKKFKQFRVYLFMNCERHLHSEILIIGSAQKKQPKTAIVIRNVLRGFGSERSLKGIESSR